MRERTKLLTAILVLTGVIVFSLGGVAMAHGPWYSDNETTQDSWGQPGWGHHHGSGAVWSEEVSGLLGLSPEEIIAQRQEGKSLVEIAAAQGVSEDALVEAILAGRADIMQQRVDAGYCTDEQADEMLAWMEQNIRRQVNQTDFGPSEDGDHCGGYGGGMGYGYGGMHRSGGMAGWGMGFH